MNRISGVLIVKNEEAMLPACLKSLASLEEVIVLDTGSTDNTCEVARKAAPNVRVIEGVYKWNDNFAEARNKAQEYATGEWIFVIDADEVLAKGERGEDGAEVLRRTIKEHPETAVFNAWIASKADPKKRHTSPRLYKNIPDHKWAGSVHNYLTHLGTVDSDIVVLAGYSPTHQKDPDRALRMLEAAVAREPESARYWYYLGREYGYKNRWADSEMALRKALELSKWLCERADAWLLLARSLWYQRRGPEARKACLEAIGINPNFKEALLTMGAMSYERERKAWEAFATHATNEGVLFRRV